jgi:alkylresorcinol/alkylpyrone synthase
VTVTGLATPSIEARLTNRLGFRSDIKRTPIFGMGCVAGAAGTARAADYLRAFPSHTALVLSVELCSLTLQREDLSIPNIIASGLFGDGAACLVMQGAQVGAKGPRAVASQAVFYPDTERIMGWDVVDSGFKVVLSAKVPNLVRDNIRGDVDGFLASHGLKRSDIRHWVAHTGGPKVLQAFEESLELPRRVLARSWASLKEVGNLSSASVLFVLSEILESEEPQPGDWGLLMAMGPGFCAELVLLRW